jgi:hypothetical protein
MTITTELSNQLLDHVYRGQQYDVPADLYLALLDADGTELVGGGYQRLNVRQSFGLASNGSIQNTSTVSWPEPAEENWVEIRSVAFYSAASGGQLLQTSLLAAPITVQQGSRLRFLPGRLSVTFGRIPDGYWQDGSYINVPDGYWVDGAIENVPDGYWDGGSLQAGEPTGVWINGQRTSLSFEDGLYYVRNENAFSTKYAHATIDDSYPGIGQLVALSNGNTPTFDPYQVGDLEA